VPRSDSCHSVDCFCCAQFGPRIGPRRRARRPLAEAGELSERLSRERAVSIECSLTRPGSSGGCAERRSPEPKVRGSNPPGRASFLASSCIFAGRWVAAWPRPLATSADGTVPSGPADRSSHARTRGRWKRSRDASPRTVEREAANHLLGANGFTRVRRGDRWRPAPDDQRRGWVARTRRTAQS
jgi:hypothetical protein